MSEATVVRSYRVGENRISLIAVPFAWYQLLYSYTRYGQYQSNIQLASVAVQSQAKLREITGYVTHTARRLEIPT